ncbi:MAG TPA: hypothetical protein DF712_13885 [Balneola sp.]|nr:hypothetical protein [Balneola sp.]
MNEETEEKIVEVEETVTIDESQPAIVDVSDNETETDNESVSQGLSEEELDKRRDKTQKRINKLVAQRKESEEREAAALQFAQQQKAEADALRGQLTNLNTGYSAEASSRIDSQEAQAKAAFKEAYESGEVDKMADAQQVMAKIAIEKERLRLFKSNQEKQQQAQEAQQNYQQQPGAQPQQEYAPLPQPDAKAVDWAEKEENSWFGKDRAMTATAFTIHQQLVEEEGFDPNSDEYYSEIDKRIRTEFPHKFEGKNARTQTVAPVSQGKTSQKSKKSVKLTPAQISVAKRLGVPLDAYAKEVAKIDARNNS